MMRIVDKKIFCTILCFISSTAFIFSFITDNYEKKSSVPSSSENGIPRTIYYKRTSTRTLRLVHVIHRHGDRSQIQTYKKDIYTESDWPQGFGQLTKLGMRQTKELGTFLRKRYIKTGFLDQQYKTKQVYSRSTDMDRTLMSAYCVLSGMFPPDKDQSWDSTVAWQPIPVHTVSYKTDPLLHKPCPAYYKHIEKAHKQNLLISEITEKYKDEIHYISRHSGEPETWTGILAVHDPIFCQHANGFQLPAWVDEKSLETLFEIRDLSSKVQRIEQTDFAYLKHGPILEDIISHMLLNVYGDKTIPYKFFHYSGHDTNVQGFLIMLGLFNDRQPPYAGCVILELHEPVTDFFVVKILYRNETKNKPYQLQLPGCTADCPFEEFIQLTKHLIPPDPDQACGITPTLLDKSFIPIGADTMFMVWIFIIVIVVIVCIRNRYQICDSTSLIATRTTEIV